MRFLRNILNSYDLFAVSPNFIAYDNRSITTMESLVLSLVVYFSIFAAFYFHLQNH